MEKFKRYFDNPKLHLLTLAIGFLLALMMALVILSLTYTSNPPTMTVYYSAIAPGVLLMLCSGVLLIVDLVRYFTGNKK